MVVQYSEYKYFLRNDATCMADEYVQLCCFALCNVWIHTKWSTTVCSGYRVQGMMIHDTIHFCDCPELVYGLGPSFILRVRVDNKHDYPAIYPYLFFTTLFIQNKKKNNSDFIVIGSIFVGFSGQQNGSNFEDPLFGWPFSSR